MNCEMWLMEMNYPLSRDINTMGILDLDYMYNILTEREKERQEKQEAEERKMRSKIRTK